ncbi:hypothetical protein RSOLAG22IIIB_03788 [Rhizoctonia solani]|uniref:Uncharacterized protein n=1 Tax=Rhizoctonia solani TaxID=456999 RepID=A0A0K6FS66_9AGAM|nr:hypothetical protein RSOLAG22IIIB_03788 [Rhizoctonia solani]
MCNLRDQPDSAGCLACRVLGTPIRECTHRKSLGMCRNRANHKSDVVYFRNTGVATINGCGYCKWAKEYPPPPGTTLPNNPGWPGCCRPPRPEDAPLIDKEHYAAIVAAWDQRALAASTIRTPSSAPKRAPIPQFSEKSEPDPSRTPPLSAASPRRQDTLRSSRDESPRYSSRRQGSYDAPTPVPPARQGSYDSQQLLQQQQQQQQLQQLQQQQQRYGTVRPPAMVSARGGGVQPPPPAPADQLSLSSLSNALPVLRASGSAMSDSGSESSNTTVGTDSTDYLSDESEEELNRLAVARAMAIERQRVEDAEYESARRGLRDIDLTTPIQWGVNGNHGTGGAGGTSSVRSMQYLSFGDAYGGAHGRRQR